RRPASAYRQVRTRRACAARSHSHRRRRRRKSRARRQRNPPDLHRSRRIRGRCRIDAQTPDEYAETTNAPPGGRRRYSEGCRRSCAGSVKIGAHCSPVAAPEMGAVHSAREPVHTGIVMASRRTPSISPWLPWLAAWLVLGLLILALTPLTAWTALL